MPVESGFWLVIALSSIVVHAYYWRFLTVRDEDTQDTKIPLTRADEKVSILIPFRNEIEHLPACINSLLQQEYPCYEIILINDHSNDGSEKLARELSYRHQYITVINNRGQGKKAALLTGADYSDADWLAMTDADCTVGPYWLRCMLSRHPDANAIVGYGPYQSSTGFFNLFIRYESWLIASQYMGWGLRNMHYMAVGRNMFVRRQIFLSHHGFDHHYELGSGSDDLLIQSLSAAGSRISYENHQDSFTYSQQQKNWLSQWSQKRRHLTTSRHYPRKVQLLLASVWIAHVLIWIGVMGLAYYASYSLVILTILVHVLVMEWFFGGLRKNLPLRIRFGMSSWCYSLLGIYYLSFSFAFLLPPNRQKRWK